MKLRVSSVTTGKENTMGISVGQELPDTQNWKAGRQGIWKDSLGNSDFLFSPSDFLFSLTTLSTECHSAQGKWSQI
ncbi:rCG36647, isoform CRA_a [Rattus norvegicus]|uniref:RCG36647, isoform CRA_a n=1 Tax=Rattus norvegicus TaxID=10116 RepID=A6JRY7_RAT|nr:rCG36647, isoform CRA_a [Rattus norvegicus]EDL78122.1 rCG36647, isoform CRA_a [Rattus norvegicus]